MIIKKDQLRFYIFTFGYAALFISKFLGLNYGYSELYYNTYQIIRNIILPICFIIMLFLISFSGREIMLILFASFFFIPTVSSSHDFFILIMFLFVALSKRVNFYDFLKIVLCVDFILVFYHIFYFIYTYFFLGSSNFVIDNNFGIRYTFGLFHPNEFPIRFFIFISLYIFLKKKVSIVDCIIISLLNLFIFEFSHSRTSLYLTFFLLFMSYLHEYVKYMKLVLVRYASEVLVVALFVFWYWLSIYSKFNSGYDLDNLNHLLSNRIYFSSQAIYELGVSLFGRDIHQYIVLNEVPIDVLYVYMLLSYGIVFVSFFCCITISLLRKLNQLSLYKEVIVILCMLIYSSFEKTMIDITLNYSMIFFSFLIYKDNISLYVKSRKK